MTVDAGYSKLHKKLLNNVYMSIAERRKADKKKMQALILKAAMKLFHKEGFKKVTIRSIAKKIEYSPATLYLYYKDKNEILYSLQVLGFEKLHKNQQEVFGIKDPLERLRAFGRIYISFALENPEYYDLMFIMRGPAKKIKEKQDWEASLRSYELLKGTVKDCMEHGYLKKSDLDSATFAFWSYVHGMASLIIRERCIMFPNEKLPAIIEGATHFLTESIFEKVS